MSEKAQLSKIKKTYEAELLFPVEKDMQKKITELFLKGTILPAEKKFKAGKALPARIEWTSPRSCRISVYEGQFHQIKRMFAGIENQVTALKRIQIANLFLDETLAPGQFRFLTEEELSGFSFLTSTN